MNLGIRAIRGLAPRLGRWLLLCALVGFGTVGLVAQAPILPSYETDDEGQIWTYIGSMGRSMQRCFVDESDGVFPGDPAYYSDNSGNLPLCPADDPVGAADLWEPTGMATFGSTPATYRLYIADRYRNRIAIFGYPTSLTPGGSTPGSDPDDWPQGQYIGNYIGAIDAFDIDGDETPGEEGETFYYPEGVAVDGSGNLFVSDFGNARIVSFTPEGVYRFQISFASGARPAYFAFTPGTVSAATPDSPVIDGRPCSTALGAGRIIVGVYSSYRYDDEDDPIDYMNQVVVFDEKFCEVATIGTANPGPYIPDPENQLPFDDWTPGPGDFTSITALAFDAASNRLYVADYDTKRVTGFQAMDASLSTWNPVPVLTVSDPGESRPWGVILDELEGRTRLVTAQPDAQRLVAYNLTFDEAGMGSAAYAFELNARGQLVGGPNGIVKDVFGRWLVSAGSRDFIDVFETPELAIIDPEAVQTGNTVQVEFSIATPIGQAVRDGVEPVAPPASADLGAAAGPFADVTVNGVPFTMPNPPVSIMPGGFARYAYTFTLPLDPTTWPSLVQLTLSATSAGGVNAPSRRVEVSLGDPSCNVTPTAWEPPRIVGPRAPHPTRGTVYGRGVKVALTATDPDGTGVPVINYIYTRGDNAEHVRSNGEPVVYTARNGVPFEIPIDAWAYSDTHTIEYWAVDGCNVATKRQKLSLLIDVEPPVAVLSLPPPAGVDSDGNQWWGGAVTARLASVSDDIFDGAAQFEVCPTGVSNAKSCAASELRQNQSDAFTTFTTDVFRQRWSVRVSDAVGNWSYWKSVTFSIDTKAPTVTLSKGITASPNAAGWYNFAVPFVAEANEASGKASSGIKTFTGVTVDPSTKTKWTWSGSAMLGEGKAQILTVTATDAAGHRASASSEVMSIDWTPPTSSASALAPAIDGVYASPVTITVAGFDNLSGVSLVEYSTNNGASWSVYTAPLTFSTSTTLRHRAVDVAGNVGNVSTSVFVVVAQPSNAPPQCAGALPSVSEIWPPNHKKVNVTVRGVTDPDRNPVTIRIDRILQDEPTLGRGDGDTSIDGGGVGTSTAWVRAERSGCCNGRVYDIFFTATDTNGGSCTGSVRVTVPHDKGNGPVIDDGIRYSSTSAGGAVVSSEVGVTARLNDKTIERAEFTPFWVAEGRIGLDGTTEHELALGKISSPAKKAQFNWVNARSVPFSLSFDGTTAKFSVGTGGGASVLTWAPPGTSKRLEALVLRTFGKLPHRVQLTDLALNGNAIAAFPSAPQGVTTSDIVLLKNLPAPAFTLTGTISISWSGRKPKRSDLSFQIAAGRTESCRCDDDDRDGDNCDDHDHGHGRSDQDDDDDGDDRGWRRRSWDARYQNRD